MRAGIICCHYKFKTSQYPPLDGPLNFITIECISVTIIMSLVLPGLSYWLSRRLPIDDMRKLELLSIHCPTQRLLRGLQILKVGGREGGREGQREGGREEGREGERGGREGGAKLVFHCVILFLQGFTDLRCAHCDTPITKKEHMFW